MHSIFQCQLYIDDNHHNNYDCKIYNNYTNNKINFNSNDKKDNNNNNNNDDDINSYGNRSNNKNNDNHSLRDKNNRERKTFSLILFLVKT